MPLGWSLHKNNKSILINHVWLFVLFLDLNMQRIMQRYFMKRFFWTILQNTQKNIIPHYSPHATLTVLIHVCRWQYQLTCEQQYLVNSSKSKRYHQCTVLKEQTVIFLIISRLIYFAMLNVYRNFGISKTEFFSFSEVERVKKEQY